jgi:S1-C subfamily serine protease
MSAIRRLVILALVSLLSTSAYATATDWTTVAALLEKSVVPITYLGHGGCTGFVIDRPRNYVLTAAHCWEQVMYADMIPAGVVARDTKQDLMVLFVKDLDKPALKLAGDDPAIGQQIASMGHGYGLQRPLFRLATVSDNKAKVEDVSGGPFVVTDAAFVPGQSGGPGVNASGEIVMIVQAASDRVGVGVGAKILKDRVGKYFEKVQP